MLADTIVASTFSTVFCVLDALDECDAKYWPEVVTLVHKIFTHQLEHGKAPLKCLLTSRPCPKIEEAFFELIEAQPDARLSADDELVKIDKDIDLVIDVKVKILATKRHLSHLEQTAIRQKLTRRSQWTYLWLSLTWPYIEQIESLTEDEYVKSVAAIDLPATVDEAYERLLRQAPNATQARKILSLVLASNEILGLDELDVMLALMDDVPPAPAFFPTQAPWQRSDAT